MLNTPFPKLLDLPRLAAQNREFSGLVPVAMFTRLRDVIVDPVMVTDSAPSSATSVESGVVSRSVSAVEPASFFIQLTFGQENGLVVMKGRVEGVVFLRCERCLVPFCFPLTQDFMLVWIRDESRLEALLEKAPLDCEPFISAVEQVSVVDLLEDELLLALPLIPMHPSTDPELDDVGAGRVSGCVSVLPSSARRVAGKTKENVVVLKHTKKRMEQE